MYNTNSARPIFINNVDKKKIPPTPKYITGPYTLSHHRSDKYEKRIYVFGEGHGNMNTCEDLKKPENETSYIDAFLKELFSKTKVFIDFYLEYPAFHKIEGEMDGSKIINRIYNEFRDCLHPDSRMKSRWSSVRFHFTDIRRMKNSASELQWLFSRLIPLYTKYTFGRCALEIFRNLEAALYSKEKYTEYIFGQAKKYPIVKKEIERSLLPENEIKKITYKYNLVSDIGDSETKSEIKKILSTGKSSKTLGIFLLAAVSVSKIMDIYQLARIFKKFRADPGGLRPEEARNVISYSGEQHSKFLRFALGELGFEALGHSENTSPRKFEHYRCLDASGFEPFFR